MKPIQLHTILNRVATKADSSLSLSFSTPEMTAQETTVLIMLARRNLTMLLTPMGETVEPPVEAKGEFNSKTPSRRLRDVLFVWFKYEQESGRLEKDARFEQFYDTKMETMIEWVKKKLPED